MNKSTYQETDLRVPRSLTYTQYENQCAAVGVMARANPWWCGRLVLEGERRFGEKAYQALEHLGLAERTLTKMARVCEAVAASRRLAGLSWAHHETVAALTPEQQADWLATAEKDQLSRAKLRQALVAAGLIKARVARKRAEPDAEAADLWARLRAALDRIKAARALCTGGIWTDAEVAEVLDAVEAALVREDDLL